MKRSILTVFLTLSLFQFTYSQSRATGLVFDDYNYSKVEKVSTFGGGFGFTEKAVDRYSLKQYTPTPNDQGQAGSCVGQATGYGGLTTAYAIMKKITNKQNINSEAYSALYIYNQINNGQCDRGSTYFDALTLLKNKGDVKIKEFEISDKDNCQLSPSSKSYSSIIKIESFDRLFDINESGNNKVTSTRAALLGNNPVLIAFNLTTEFTSYQIKKNNNFYKPTPYAKKRGGHAMFVIGYDDKMKAFELQNSWGSNWGNNGYFYISYEDFATNCKYAYIMKLKEEIEPNQPKVNLNGSFTFNSIEYANGSVQKIKQSVINKGKYYELNKSDWQIGSQFQVIADNISKGDYVYVFSIDSEKSPFVHFPKNGKLNSHYFGFGESPIVPYDNAKIYIPSKTTALTKDKEGTDYLFVLFSELKLDEKELKNDIDRLANSSGDLVNNFYSIFGEKLIQISDLNYSSSSMKVNVNTSKGFIAPIILKVK